MAAKLFLTAASPVLQAGCLVSVGAALAWKGILDESGTSTLARVVFYAFTPSLTFSTLGASITLQSLQNLWPLFLNITLTTLLGLGAGTLLGRLLRAPTRMRPLITCACAFANVGNLPLVFVSSLCNEHSSMFRKALAAKCEQVGVSYVGVNMCAATLFQFTLAIYLLKPPGRDSSHVPLPLRESLHEVDVIGGDEKNSHDGMETFSEETLPLVSVQHRTRSHVADPERSLGSIELQSIQRYDRSGMGHAIDAMAMPEHGVALEEDGETERGMTEASGIKERKFGKDHDMWHRIGSRIMHFDWASAFPLPTQAAVAGTVVGCVPPIRRLLFDDNEPYLKPISEALRLLANGLIPSSIPLLGAVLFSCMRGPAKPEQRGNGSDDALPHWTTTLAVVFTRLIFIPMFMLGFDVLMVKLRLFAVPDAMFLLTMLLSNTTPTAINMQVSL